MKRATKLVGYILVGIVILLLISVGSVYALSRQKLNRTYDVTVKPLVIPTDQAAILHGKHIANTRGCIDCHGTDFAGQKVIDDPAIGVMHGTNLTNGRGGITTTFTDEDWIRAIRHGIAKDGRPLVLMPSVEFSEFSDADLGSLIAFLKTLPPVDRDRVPIKVGPVARALILKGDIKLAAEHIDHAGVAPSKVIPGVTAEFGGYLAAGCTGCHGTTLAGGRIPGGPPDWPLSRNLTPGGDLAKWNEADFFRLLKTGVRPDGTQISPVMPLAFGNMNDIEIKALWTYLKTLPAVASGNQ